MATQISNYLARIGKKGGQAKGASKRRGNSAYYRRIAKLKRKAANAQAEARHRMPLPPAPGSAQKEEK